MPYRRQATTGTAERGLQLHSLEDYPDIRDLAEDGYPVIIVPDGLKVPYGKPVLLQAGFSGSGPRLSRLALGGLPLLKRNHNDGPPSL
jgi:hypothetical protein